jgi:hypothetical protein
VAVRKIWQYQSRAEVPPVTWQSPVIPVLPEYILLRRQRAAFFGPRYFNIYPPPMGQLAWSPPPVDYISIKPQLNRAIRARLQNYYSTSWLTTWLSDWLYRKLHVIDLAAGAGANYTVKITVHYGSGTDTGEDIYCNGHSKGDFGDIRFTTNDGTTLLDHWLESKTDSDNAVFWIKVSQDLSNQDIPIYLYYGKSDAVSVSNGYNTFPFFDTFDIPIKTIGVKTLDASAWGSIIKVGSIYYMFHSEMGGGPYNTWRAQSTDLINWTNDTKIIDGVGQPGILTDVDGVTPVTYDGKYWLAVRKSTSPYNFQIYYASTIDGAWTYSSDAIGVGTGWESANIGTICFVNEGSIYYIFYEGWPDWTPTSMSIGYASASTPNGTYTKNPGNPVLTATLGWEGVGVCDVRIIKEGSTYYLFYTGNKGTSCCNSYAVSLSLTGTWTKSERQIGSLGISYPVVVKHTDGYYYMNGDDLNNGYKIVYRGDSIIEYRPKFWFLGNKTAVDDYLQVGPGVDSIVCQNWICSPLVDRPKAMRHKTLVSNTGVDKFAYGGLADFALAQSTLAPHAVIGYRTGDGSTVQVGVEDPTQNAYHTYDILWTASNVIYKKDGTVKATHTNPPSIPMGVYFRAYTPTEYIRCDWALTRNYVYPEPAHSTWGDEEYGGIAGILIPIVDREMRTRRVQ